MITLTTRRKSLHKDITIKLIYFLVLITKACKMKHFLESGHHEIEIRPAHGINTVTSKVRDSFSNQLKILAEAVGKLKPIYRLMNWIMSFKCCE